MIGQPRCEQLAVAQHGVMFPLLPSDRSTVLQADRGDPFWTRKKLECGAAQATTVTKRRRVFNDVEALPKIRERVCVRRIKENGRFQGLPAKDAARQCSHTGNLGQDFVKIPLGGIGSRGFAELVIEGITIGHDEHAIRGVADKRRVAAEWLSDFRTLRKPRLLSRPLASKPIKQAHCPPPTNAPTTRRPKGKGEQQREDEPGEPGKSLSGLLLIAHALAAPNFLAER